MSNYFLIDGLNLSHRATNVHYELKTGAGLFSGMFYGFIRVLISLRKKYRDFKFIVVWDNRASWKYEIQPDYKAGRSRISSNVFTQVDDIKLFLKNCGVDQYEKQGQEADDVIATLTETLKKEPNSKVYIYSNDKDFLQLVEDGKVIVYKPKIQNIPEKFYDEEAVKVQFGVHPSRLAEFRSLDGDNSDNITGIPKVKRKLLANLINKCASIEDIYDILPEEKLTDFERKSLLDNKEKVLNNYKIVNLRRDLNLLVCACSNYDEEAIIELFKKYEIKSLNPEEIIELFRISSMIRTSEPARVKLEPYSLFD